MKNWKQTMLTHKKRLYAQARLAGKNQTDSAIFAGCPESTAAQAASRYEKDPEILAHMKRLKAGAPQAVQTQISKTAKEVYQKPDVQPSASADPLDYLRRVMENEGEDPKLRMEAAKTLASYLHVKPGEKGKKEQRQEDAEKVTARFAPSAPPKLVAVAGVRG